MAVWDGSAAQPVAYLAPVFSAGGGVSLVDENGTLHAEIGPSLNPGAGGALVIMRNDSAEEGFVVDGNYLNTESARVVIDGNTTMTFDASASDPNDSVVQPFDSVGRAEILDEPGVVSDINDAGALWSGATQSMASQSINCPDPGYVLVIGTAEIWLDHYGSGAYFTTVKVGVTDDVPLWPANQDVEFAVPSSAPNGQCHFGATVHGLF